MSARSWVVSTTVVSPRSRSSARNARTACLLTTSSPIVGSSRNSTCGPCSSATVSSPRIRWPSESCRTGVSRKRQVELTRSSRASRAAWSAGGTRQMCRASSNESRSGRSHHSCERCPNTTPIRAARRLPLRHRHQPADPHLAAAGHEHAGEHLQRGRLAGAVRAEVAEHLAALDPQVDAVDGGHRLPLAAQAAGLAGDGELLAQPARLDHSVGTWSPPR